MIDATIRADPGAALTLRVEEMRKAMLLNKIDSVTSMQHPG